MGRIIDGYCRLLEWAIAAALAVMVVLVFGNVVLRYGFNSGITVSEEVSRWLFVWLTFLGGIVALREHAHLGTDLLVSRLGRNGRRACLAIGQLTMLFITWLLLRGSFEQTLTNLDVHAPVTGVPVAVFYAAGLVFAVSAGVILATDLVRTVMNRVSDDELVIVRESEDLAVLEQRHVESIPPIGQGPHSTVFRH